jgi:hypothetical protein
MKKESRREQLFIRVWPTKCGKNGSVIKLQKICKLEN